MPNVRGSKRKPTTPEEFSSRREAHEEFIRLTQRYWQLREFMTPEAIVTAWIFLGDAMWEGEQVGRLRD